MLCRVAARSASGRPGSRWPRVRSEGPPGAVIRCQMRAARAGLAESGSPGGTRGAVRFLAFATAVPCSSPPSLLARRSPAPSAGSSSPCCSPLVVARRRLRPRRSAATPSCATTRVLGHMRFLLEDDPPRAAAVLHRAQLRRPPLRPRHPHARSTSGPRASRTSRPSAPSATSTSRATSTCVHSTAPGRPADGPAAGADRRPGLHPALRHGAAQRLGDELRRAVGATRCARSTQGARPGGFAHDTGEGGLHRVPPRARRRPRLGDRQRLLRRAHQGRRLRRAASSATRRPHDARQAASRSSSARAPSPASAACCPAAKVTPGDRRGARRAAGREVRQPAGPHGVLARRASSCASSPSMRELAGGKPAGFKLCVGSRARVPRHLQGDGRGGHRRRTSSSSTAPRAAPARRRWSTRTTSARRSPRA